MRPCWMLLLLLGCTLLCGVRSRVTCEGPSGGVLVPCPNTTGDEGNFSLRRGQQTVCTFEWRRQAHAQRATAPCPNFDAKLHAGEDGKVEGFVVTAASQSAGIYMCKFAVTFPVPLKKFLGPPVTLLQVDGRQCDDKKNQSASAGIRGEEEAGRGSPWAWMTAVALLAVYGLVVTVLAVISLRKLRSPDSYSDYMNTKPRDRRRPQGIQVPIPRHF